MIHSKMEYVSYLAGLAKANLRNRYSVVPEEFKKRAKGFRLVFDDHPYRMDYARDIAQDCQHNVDPKLHANTHLQEHA